MIPLQFNFLVLPDEKLNVSAQRLLQWVGCLMTLVKTLFACFPDNLTWYGNNPIAVPTKSENTAECKNFLPFLQLHFISIVKWPVVRAQCEDPFDQKSRPDVNRVSVLVQFATSQQV